MKNNAVKWLFEVTGKKKLYVVLLIAIQALYGGSGVLYALLLRNIVDSAVNHDSTLFWENVLLTFALVAAQVILRAITRYLEEKSRSSLENQFKRRLFGNILYKDFAKVSSVHSGEWMNRLTNDCMVTANNFTEILPGMAGMFVKLASAGIMLIVLDSRFAVLFIPFGIVMLFMTYFFRKSLKKLHKKIQESDGRLRIFLQERLGSLIMIRSFSAEKQTSEECNEKMAEHHTARMKKNHFSNLCNIGFQSGMQGMYLAGVCYCGYGILTGVISYGTLTAVTQLISQIQSPFANITGYLPKYYAMTASAERLMEIEYFNDDCENEPCSMKKIKDFYNNNFDRIKLDNISFKYYPSVKSTDNITKSEMPVVLDNISLTINKSEYVAFTGHSGCGKSTVLKLLMCVYRQDSGDRSIFDINGKKYCLDSSWQRLFAYVPQGNQLMSGTVRDVVAFSDIDEKFNDFKINYALKIACADSFVNELEDGIDTMLGERGAGLSEGQMQRIAVARAIFSESPILILDEATSSLDEKTEKQLLQNLREMTDKTVVIVTHRPAALDICSKILNFTEKGIEEYGKK